MKSTQQTTLGGSVTLTGVGVHSGERVSVTLAPAEANSGYVIVGTDADGSEVELHADYSTVVATELATVLGSRNGPLVSTAEHVLAALRGMGVDNATIEIDGPEMPIMDGSAAPFVEAIDSVGVTTLSAPRRFIEVLKPVQVAFGDSFGELRPHAAGFRLELDIEFADATIGRQAYVLDLTPTRFRKDISRARTFGRMCDVSKLLSAGFARGAGLENAIVVDDGRVLNPEGLRYADEFVRHKVLDAVGDLALAGLPLLGAYRSVRGGHKLNHAVLCALMADRSAWRVVEVAPARRVRGSAEVAGSMATPAFGPDVS
jgi:UDP-3-O-[3-hydroxymyristoyl] N-acetylglucosamine deacetylase